MLILVRVEGLEPPCLAASGSKPDTSANSAILAYYFWCPWSDSNQQNHFVLSEAALPICVQGHISEDR